MIKIQRRIVAAISGLGLAAASLLGITASAQAIASTTFDCFPASNNPSSTESTGCSDLNHYHPAGGSGADVSGRIEWNNAAGSIDVRGILTDTAADGRGPYLRVQLFNGLTGTYSPIMTFHNTLGNGQTLNELKSFGSAGRPLSSKDSVTVWVCNGITNGQHRDCEEFHHGPFHNY